MKLHQRTVAKILNMVQNLGGHRDDTKLRQAFEGMDFMVYTKESNEDVLVETEDYNKQVQQLQRVK